MRKFRVKGSENYPEILTIVHEADDKLKVLLEKNNGYGLESREEIMSKQLFDSCLRTNYLTEILTA
ncbi:MAG: hypothetical protein B6229_05090 [Spirochaetaceae bacterium 4572_7]|nr:MAG: hypothetical protein B6229_05090 [Spirochaetaceae bacterium 4572_7]